MRLFRKIELPNSCYITEAAYWLALGRVPEESIHEEGHPSRLTDGIGLQFDFDADGFRKSEFDMLGIQIDFERYLSSRLTVGGRNAAFYLEGPIPTRHAITEFWSRYGEVTDEYVDMMEEKDRKFRDEANWILELESSFSPIVDRARAIIVEALSDGRLEAGGFVEVTDEYRNRVDYDGSITSFESIQNNYWAYRYVDWDESSLRLPSATFTNVQVLTSDLLAQFPLPLMQPQSMKGGIVGETFIPDEISNSTPSSVRRISDVQRGRGRPPALEKEQSAMIENHLQYLLTQGKLPKQDAIIAELQELLMANFGRTPKRTVLQGKINLHLSSQAEKALNQQKND
ncbi:hypothetical protein ACCS39_27345 [Rhizobium ruizarguesonis]